MSVFYNPRQFTHLIFVIIKTIKMRFILLIALSTVVLSLSAQTELEMKLNAGIITDKLQETKKFYSEVLNFGVSFENEFYLLMHTPNKSAEISFLLPNHPSQKPMFQKAHSGNGTYFTIEVEDVDQIYNQIKNKNVSIAIELRDEIWGDRHFAIMDPNGIGIDIVTYTKPSE